MLSDEEVEALGMETVTMAYAEPRYGTVSTGRVHVHRAERCSADPNPCVLHSPSDHHMRDWGMVLRLDREGLVERTCPHGVGHPDPDSLAWLMGGYRSVYKDCDPSEDFSWVGTHGCDGCCRQEET